MLQTEYGFTRNKIDFSVYLRQAGVHLSFLDNSPKRKWFWVTLTPENFPAFKREVMELGIDRRNPNFDRDVVSLDGVTCSDKLVGLKLYIKRSEKRSGWLDLRIMNEPEKPLLKFEFRANELANLIDQTMRLFLK